jgi:AcrR family transcriptional regulator
VKSAAERRHELLEAASEVLRARGASETRVEDITTRAGVAKGTFYRYFDSKEDIVLALREEVGRRIFGEVAARVGTDWRTPDDWWRAADTMTEVFLDYLLDQTEEHLALWHGPAAAITATGGDDAFGLLVPLVEQGVAAGAFATDDPELTVTLLFHAVHGASDWALAHPSVDRRRVLAATNRLTRSALAPP